MQRIVPWAGSLLLLAISACGESRSAEQLETPLGPAFSHAPAFPDLIPLPAGFGPEGIAVGKGSTFYAGSLNPSTFGQILVGDLRTGAFTVLVAPTGRPALGIKYDARSNLLFVAGGPFGRGTVYDASSGAEVTSYQFVAPLTGSVINDVVVTRDAAYFTDSQRASLYRVSLAANGQPGSASTMALPSNFTTAGSCPMLPPLKANGIAATANGKYLILVHMTEGQLYRIDTATGAVDAVTLTGGDVCAGDGLLLDGKTLYVVKNFQHRVAVIDMAPDYLSGVVSRHITEPFASNPGIKVPTTIAEFGNSLYTVTAGFAGPPQKYVVRLSK